MEYANQIQELTEHSVSGCASGCTHCLHFLLAYLILLC